MFRRMLTMIRKDALTGSRDQLIAYMLLSPILLGLMVALLMPILEQSRPSFVVDSALPRAAVEAFQVAAEVEQVKGREALERRVLGRDDTIGIVADASEPSGVEVVVQGDEDPRLQVLPRVLLEHATRVRQDEAVPAGDFALGDSTRPQLRLIATALTVYAVTAVVGLMLGFTILQEKSTQTHLALLMAPVRFAEYFGAKLLMGLALAVVMAVPAVALPFGFDVDWGGVLLSVAVSVPFAISMGLIVGVVAKDQLGAVAIMKGLLPVWTSLPILGFVLPDAWTWTLYPFANHWGVQGLYAASSGSSGVGTDAVLNLVTGLPVLALSGLALRRRLGFR